MGLRLTIFIVRRSTSEELKDFRVEVNATKMKKYQEMCLKVAWSV